MDLCFLLVQITIISHLKLHKTLLHWKCFSKIYIDLESANSDPIYGLAWVIKLIFCLNRIGSYNIPTNLIGNSSKRATQVLAKQLLYWLRSFLHILVLSIFLTAGILMFAFLSQFHDGS